MFYDMADIVYIAVMVMMAYAVQYTMHGYHYMIIHDTNQLITE